ncbi:MAG: hemerythrin domain-containing protein [Chloroflexi bacterium]|nr:hemerythrin domain-containing protein [Chloroflexota bacterium]
MTDVQTPVELLRDEHQAVLQKLEALESVIANLEEKDKVATELRELAAFFETDFWVHFDKEEKALFPEFDSFMPRGRGPLAAMIEEHETLRRTNAVMQQAVTRYLSNEDSAETRRLISQYGMHFISFLRDHISKEDSLLFRMAEMHLNEGQNARVVRLFAEMGKIKS